MFRFHLFVRKISSDEIVFQKMKNETLRVDVTLFKKKFCLLKRNCFVCNSKRRHFVNVKISSELIFL